MKSLFRATVMLGALATLGWAVQEFGPENTIQPVARQAIAIVDRLLNERGITGDERRVPRTPSGSQSPSLKLIADTSSKCMEPVTPPISRGLRNGPFDQITAPSLLSNLVPHENPALEATERANNDASCESSLVRLKNLGAKQITVVAWGKSGLLHRCSCEVPLPNLPLATSQFDSIAKSADGAVRHVLEQVESWQTQHGVLVHR